MLVVSVPRLHVSMSPWARPVYGGGLYLYGHDSRSPLIKISNANCLWVLVLLYNQPEWALLEHSLSTFSGALQVLSYFLPHHNLVDAMETKMQIGVVQCFVSVGLQM